MCCTGEKIVGHLPQQGPREREGTGREDREKQPEDRERRRSPPRRSGCPSSRKGQAPDRRIKRSDQRQASSCRRRDTNRPAPAALTLVTCWKIKKSEQAWNPQDQEKHQRSGILGEDNLPIANRSRHQRLPPSRGFASSAKTRIVISGNTSMNGNRKYTVLKNASTTVVEPAEWFRRDNARVKIESRDQ